MATTTYAARMPWGETVRFCADLTQASAPICTIDDDGETHATQYQTADAHHRSSEALRLVVSACGRDYYAQPGDIRYNYEILDEVLDGVSIDAEAE